MEKFLTSKKAKYLLLAFLLLFIALSAVTTVLLIQKPVSKNTSASNVTTTTTVVTTSTPTQVQTNVPTTTATPSATQAPTNTSVKVYFSKMYNDGIDVFPFDRSTNREDIGTYVIEQYILGPTAQEKAQGYYTELTTIEGVSNCDGKDFSLKIEDGKATLKFCRTVYLIGTMADGRFENALKLNLKQFPSVQKVVILNKDGKCLFDNSGLNMCDK